MSDNRRSTGHMIVAVTRHPDGSQSSRIWTATPTHLDHLTATMGEPDAHTHVPAQVRAEAAGAVARMSAQSIVVRRDPGRMDP